MGHPNATRREMLKIIAMVSMAAVLLGSKALDPKKSARPEGSKSAIDAPDRRGRLANAVAAAADPRLEGSR